MSGAPVALVDFHTGARRAPNKSPPARASHSYRWRRPTTARRSRPTRRRGPPELSDLPTTTILSLFHLFGSTCLVPLAPDETSARPAPARLSEAAAHPVLVSCLSSTNLTIISRLALSSGENPFSRIEFLNLAQRVRATARETANTLLHRHAAARAAAL